MLEDRVLGPVEERCSFSLSIGLEAPLGGLELFLPCLSSSLFLMTGRGLTKSRFRILEELERDMVDDGGSVAFIATSPWEGGVG